MVSTPWAVILCKFNDDATEPKPRRFYERLFTGAGAGSHNMTDFFRDVSHGTLDLNGSQIFGWYTLPIPKSAFAGNVDTPPPGQYNRNSLYDLVVQTARNNGAPVDTFFGIVVSMNVPVDLWGGGGRRAFCDPLSLQPSLLGQEMGHGYGLDHARRDGSEEDYLDPWDVMSTANADEAPNADYEFIGPGLNAWNMRGRGWLDEARVWRAVGDSYDTLITLRPLHRHDLPGVLAAELPGGFLAEFRVTESWDAGVPRPAVLIHRFTDNHSYIMAGVSGADNLGVGDAFQRGDERFAFGPFTRVEVVGIDTAAHTATLRVRHYPGSRRHDAIFGTVFGGVAVDGGGGVFVGNHFFPVPPRGPEFRVLSQLALLDSSSLAATVTGREAIQREAWTAVRDEAARQIAALTPFGVPAPRAKEHQQ